MLAGPVSVRATGSVLNLTLNVSLVFWLFLLAFLIIGAVALILLRRKAPAPTTVTWDCGYIGLSRPCSTRHHHSPPHRGLLQGPLAARSNVITDDKFFLKKPGPFIRRWMTGSLPVCTVRPWRGANRLFGSLTGFKAAGQVSMYCTSP